MAYSQASSRTNIISLGQLQPKVEGILIIHQDDKNLPCVAVLLLTDLFLSKT